MLHVVTWKWGTKYGNDYVHKLAAGLKRHVTEPHTFTCITDDTRGLSVNCEYIRDPDLLEIKGCFARLRLFDDEAQKKSGIEAGHRIVCIDLDVIPVRNMDKLFYRPEPFLILQGANAINPNPFNGSLWMLRAGYRPDIWTDFSLEKLDEIPRHDFPDDQGWFWYKLPDAPGWKVGPSSGIYAFQKPGWPKDDQLPSDACLVVFPGWRDPVKFNHLPWIREHWCL